MPEKKENLFKRIRKSKITFRILNTIVIVGTIILLIYIMFTIISVFANG